MPIIFARVDDRLIHGQVVQAWLPELNIDEVVIPCPKDKEHRLNKNLLRLCLPFEYELTILEPCHCVEYMEDSDKRILLLMESLQDMDPLLKDGLQIPTLNIGGMHFKEQALKLAENVFLNEQDKQTLRILNDLGIDIETRAVPSSKSVSIKEIL
ncbi:MAG: PTS sugar transporter subunit IIB [Elusimicrobiaceae bacterium]|nr:PTS sugar transporter subunit IIB [Elusimicrobiaceae bacterium]MBR3898728.1 PTS sugar transporter subunit IIB [Elusimicrobiaceae bacterium]